MIINNQIYKIITITLISILVFSNTACDFEKDDYKNEALNERVQTNIEEAKTVSDIVILNEALLKLNSLPQVSQENYQIKEMSDALQKDQLEIKKSIDNLAENKLILLPTNFDENEIDELSKVNETNFTKAYLTKTATLIKSQKEQLKYLSTITNDIDFRVLTVQSLVKLNSNLNKIQKVLKTNY